MKYNAHWAFGPVLHSPFLTQLGVGSFSLLSHIYCVFVFRIRFIPYIIIIIIIKEAQFELSSSLTSP
jgi:hypothetical protein